MKQFGDHYDTRVYQPRTSGGKIMGEDPKAVWSTAFTNMGRTQCVCNGFERLSAEYRLQSDGFGWSIDILVRQSHS